MPTAGGFELAVEGELRVTITRERRRSSRARPGGGRSVPRHAHHLAGPQPPCARKRQACAQWWARRCSRSRSARPRRGPGGAGVGRQHRGARHALHGDRRRGAGQVELHEGAIDFRDETGVVRLMKPGEVLRWPVEPEAPLILPSSMSSRRWGRSGEDRPRAHRRLAAFDQRARPGGDHRAGMACGRRASGRRRQWAARARAEPVVTPASGSFEPASLHLAAEGHAGAACAHWHQHRREYPEGRSDSEAQRALLSLGAP